MTSVRGVLFDLDGTLLDTAPDLVYALNLLRAEHQLPELPLETIRPIANVGSKAMLKLGFDVDDTSPRFNELREKFLEIYQDCLAVSTRFFPNAEKVLNHLDNHNIPWGIVTNKPSRPTLELLRVLKINHRPACVICGDTLAKAKPHPEPILHGCELLKLKPQDCLYIGDAATDVLASKAAGTKSLVAMYGYINHNEDPFSWAADGYVYEPIEIIEWLAKYPLN